MPGLLDALGLTLPKRILDVPGGPARPMPPPPADPGRGAAGGTATVPPPVAPAPAAAPPAQVPVDQQLAALATALGDAKNDIAALQTAPLKDRLNKELATLVESQTKVKALAASAAAVVLTQLLPKAKDLAKRCAELKAGEPAVLLHQKNWAVDRTATLKTLIGGKPQDVKAVMQPQLDKITKRLSNLKFQIEKGDFKAADAIAEEIFFAAEGVTRAINDYATDHPAYQVERDKAEAAIRPLKSHKAAASIQAEIKELEQKLIDADAVASKADTKGWQKATVAVKQIPELAKRVKTLADELAKVAAKLPALKKAFADAGADAAASARMAGYAQRMIVEEKVSDQDAIKMAKDADGFVKAGLDETDAVMSSRVKRSLVSGGTPEDVAQEIGKNLRAGGLSNADDAKAVAAGMKKFPKKMLESMNKAGIQTECCRGPVTEALPELAGVQPRGWPAGSTWDQVPGVYSPSTKKVVVGTMEKDGKRHVPGKGEGPIPHGTPDLIGHEGGHAYDISDGGYKSKHADFLAARQKDVTAGNPSGMYGPRDNYFLTSAEGGTNDAGATSETFAESFAMHFGSAAKKWPELEKFWVANPWGA